MFTSQIILLAVQFVRSSYFIGYAIQYAYRLTTFYCQTNFDITDSCFIFTVDLQTFSDNLIFFPACTLYLWRERVSAVDGTHSLLCKTIIKKIQSIKNQKHTICIKRKTKAKLLIVFLLFVFTNNQKRNFVCMIITYRLHFR